MPLSGSDLKAARKQIGWTQQYLADRAETHVAAVKYWEARKCRHTSGCAVDRFIEVLRDAGAIEVKPILNAARFNARTITIVPQPIDPPKTILCGATTRKGKPCRAKGTGRGNRCNSHGGASTGPKTAAGRERIEAAQRKRWEDWHANVVLLPPGSCAC